MGANTSNLRQEEIEELQAETHCIDIFISFRGRFVNCIFIFSKKSGDLEVI